MVAKQYGVCTYQFAGWMNSVSQLQDVVELLRSELTDSWTVDMLETEKRSAGGYIGYFELTYTAANEYNAKHDFEKTIVPIMEKVAAPFTPTEKMTSFWEPLSDPRGNLRGPLT